MSDNRDISPVERQEMFSELDRLRTENERLTRECHKLAGFKVEAPRMLDEIQRLKGEVESLKKQSKIDNEGNQDWINSLCSQLCKMEDALGFKNDCYDKKGKWVPTIGPWLERVRDLLAAEGELGDAKETGYPAGVVETGNRQKRNMKTPNVNQRLKMLARKAKPPRKGGAYNLEMRVHDHKCHCGGINGEHETGTQGCFRFMTEAPAVRPDDHWFVDGDEITDYTLRHQRGYHQHDCGCWSRWPGSENSI